MKLIYHTNAVQIKLHNRRVIVAKDEESYCVYFKRLCSQKEVAEHKQIVENHVTWWAKNILITKVKLTKEAAIALHSCLTHQLSREHDK